MKQYWSESELIENWGLTDSERNLLDQRTEHGLLGFGILLKFFQIEGRFPLNHKEVPSIVVEFMAEMHGLSVSAWIELGQPSAIPPGRFQRLRCDKQSAAEAAELLLYSARHRQVEGFWP